MFRESATLTLLITMAERQNRVPDDLYHHGVQRERMSSFLSALKARCDVVTLDGGRDYRRSSEEEPQEKWFTTEQEDHGFEAAWQGVLGQEGMLPLRNLSQSNDVETDGGR